ncbi:MULTISPECIES: MobV family relaxase [Calothrix]|uniref:Plasmid recombination protein n=2 Tax=Calothrix TaxID=1186 RepID=A0ABR8AKN4_9CYAN|nr:MULTISPECIES: MobV family relaxase [Calothrix]MBD2200536.1 plasmid recombination protein [Calothrix parietina FACHB-288]MBD2229572.1 plasmid recombination protein [Calothrix anomala FACHB-343]
MALAICRIQKIKSWGVLARSEAHTSRLVDIPNANPDIRNLEVIVNSDNLDLETLVRNKIGDQKIRSDAVLAVEMLLSASAEYFRPLAPYEGGVYDKQRLDDFVEAVVKWLHSSWSDRIINAELHLDEITPHIHAYLVPLDERGKLNCKALFGTRSKMYELQNSFAAAVAHLGILRGIKGSVATHKQIRKYYAAVNQDSQILDLERCLPPTQAEEASESYRKRVIEILSPQLEIINYQISERSHILQQKAELKQTASRSEQLRQQLERELKILQATSSQLDLPLSKVAYELGLNQYKQEDNALSLVMQVHECTFDDAVVWLRDRFGETQMLHAVTNRALTIAQQTPTTMFVPPISDHKHWEEVENYLKQKYSIPPKLLQTLHQRSLVYGDNSGNAVFLARNLNGEATGAYLYSLNNHNRFSLHPGSRRSFGWFHLSIGGANSESIQTAIIITSPINALSAIARKAPHKNRTLYLALDNQHAPLPLELLKTVPSVIVAMPESRIMSLRKILPHVTSDSEYKEQQQY